ncbi:fimbria/pilus outer membrane usher protein [uncultured Massilia sp.]|uniref:fimbria/pilus outer membrane usher protein n=1 Tax=uncultured Massilia sp. TaxID=169973 RepID=UPI0025CC361A|nr:fimbria/pilus outer membrane usher protein [uncultured Massilia sp.]
MAALLLAASCAAHGAAGPAASAAPDSPAAPAAPAAAPDAIPQPPAQVELYLEVSLNGEETGAVLPFVQGPRGLRSSVANLAELGLDAALFGVAGQDAFDLDGIPGLHYAYDERRQRLDLRLDDALRRPQELRARALPRSAPPAADGGRGLLLNYSLHAQRGVGTALNAVTELRWFDRYGVLSTTGAAVLRGTDRGYVRYDTTWTRADPATLSTLEIGDVITASLSWSRSLRIGGVQWRRNFGLRPDLLTYPVASYGGSAVVPSSVSLYVNGIRQFQADVGGGPFQLRDIAGLNGAGQATVVTEDALGRVVSATLPLYVDTRLLETGLTDYAVALGAPRRAYGAASFSYAPTPVASASVRHGASDVLTLEGHGEAGGGLANLGAGLLLRLGQAGVASASLAGSAGRLRGAQAAIGYQYIASRFAIDAERQRASAGYGDLGAGAGAPTVRASDRLNLSVALAGGRSAGFGLINYKVAGEPAARIVSLSLSSHLAWGMHLTVSAYRDLRRPDARGLQASLSIPLGERAAGSATFGSQNGQRLAAATASSAPDFGGGFGWNVQAGRFGDQRYDQAQLLYLGSAGQLGMTTQSAGTARATTIDASGALVAMDGAFLPARHVGRGFALVATGMADVPVLQENRVIGRTDGAGRLLVPDLMPYTSNEIAIDVSALPADVRVPSVRQAVVPRQSSGVLARFALERYAAASVILHDADGNPLPVGTPVRVDGGTATVVGYDGVVFVDGVTARTTLTAGEGARACTVHVAPEPGAGAGGALPVIGPLVCHPKEKP